MFFPGTETSRYPYRVVSRRLLLRVSLLVTLLAEPAVAGLSARLVYLRSGTAETCPDQSALKHAVAKRLGYDPFLLSAPHMIVAELSGESGVLRARARLLDENGVVLGSRELTGQSQDCSELIASLALAISLTLDPLVAAADAPTSAVTTTDQPTQKTSPKPSDDARIEPKRVATGQPESNQPALNAEPLPINAPLSFGVHVGILGSLGWLPSLSYAPTLGVMARGTRLSLGLDGLAVASRSSAMGGLKADVSLAYAALWPCVWMGNVATCALATLGRYSGEGGGVSSPRLGNHVHAAAGLRLVGSVPLTSRWGFEIVADGVRNLVRPEFLVDGQTLYRPAAWAGNLGVFLSWTIL
ncbi:MAG TPA: hypothetical protein VIV60_15750 [Polyangiaceae bacterium]